MGSEFAGNLIILRGLPGSGKTTLANLLSEKGKYPIYSIDDYFTDKEGNYNFEFSNNHKAYKHCEDRAEAAMKLSVPKIFIDNVFSLAWELEAYFKLAAKYAYRLHVLTVENYHTGVNIHGIGEDQILRMAEKYKVKLF